MSTAPANVAALESGTGISWDAWVTFLDASNARDLDHTQMAKLALDHMLDAGDSTSPEWWAQGVAVAYEQHIGRRVPGQRSEGDFSVAVSKTMPGDMDAVLLRWARAHEGLRELDGVPMRSEPSTSETEKWRYWRVSLEDGSTISVNIQTKVAKSGDVKSALAVNHDKIPQADDVERWRAFWKGITAKVASA